MATEIEDKHASIFVSDLAASGVQVICLDVDYIYDTQRGALLHEQSQQGHRRSTYHVLEWINAWFGRHSHCRR